MALFSYLLALELRTPQGATAATITVKDMRREEMPSIRRVGLDQGRADTVLIESDPGIKEGMDTDIPSEQTQNLAEESPAKMSLQDLSLTQTDIQQTPQQQEVFEDQETLDQSTLQITDLSGIPIIRDPRISPPRIDQSLAMEQRSIQNSILEHMGLGPGAQVARRGNMFMRFEPPEGISYDELNTLEKIFYGFQVRVFESYVRALILSYNDLSARRPQLDHQLRTNRYTLSARVTFDRAGNIIAIKTTRWTNQRDVQDFFEKTLTNIGNIPNIPKELIGEDSEFSIHYILQIN